jgi:DNA-binding SARP family transcriptional activator
MLRFGVLGPLEVLDDAGVPIDVGGRQPRIVLAVLLVAGRSSVPADVIVEAIWGGGAPASASGTLQSYVSRLRRSLGPDHLVWDKLGYRLELAPTQVDASRFEILADEGRQRLEEGRPAEARAVLEEALALWRGPALADVADLDFATGFATRMEQRRMSALEDRVVADLELGRHAAVIGELTELAAAHPLWEAVHAHLALALYRSDRQAEALRVIANAGRTLREELGIEPGHQLRDLEAAILAQDPSLAPPAAARPAPATAPEYAPPAAMPAAVTPRASSLIGREPELEQLMAAFDESAGDARFVVIEGEPGIGKTRLADELRQLAEGRGALTLWGRSDEGGAAPALWPWLPPLRAVVERAPAPAVPPALAELLDGEVSTGAGQAQAVQFERFEAVAEVVSGVAARQPLVILLDDLQWADATSLELLGFLVARLGPGVLVIGTVRRLEVGRNDAVTEALSVIARRQGSRRLQLRGLTRQATAAVLDAAANRNLPPAVSAAIHARAEGNPFYAIELSRLVDEEGGLGGEVPGGVGDVIRRRLGRLAGATVQLLGVAAAVGRDVDVHLLAAAAGQPLDAVLDGLEPAVVHRLLVEVPDLPSTLRFSHALVREVLLEDMTSLRRARLHLKVADAIEAGGAGVDDIEILAEHLLRAAPVGVGRRAAEALERAADVALRRVSYDAAEDLLAKAVQLRRATGASLADQEAELLTICRVLEVARARRYFQGAARMDLIERAKELAERCDRRDLLLNMLRFEWSALATSCQAALAGPLAHAFFDLTVDDPRPDVRANGHEMIAVLYWGAGRISDAVKHLDIAVALFDEAPSSDDDGLAGEQRMLSQTFWIYNHAAHGDLSAEDASARFDALITAHPDPFSTASICGFAATTANALGRFDEVDRFVGIRRAADPAGQFVFWVAQSLMHAGIADAWKGEASAAIARFEEGKARYLGIGARSGLSGFEASLALNLADRGEVNVAIAHVTAARAELERYGERWNEPLVLIAEAVVAFRGDDPAAAAMHLAQAVDCATGQGAAGIAERARAVAKDLGLDL